MTLSYDQILFHTEWTPLAVHPVFLQIVGRTSARIFVGSPLCREPLWLETSIDFARCVFLGSSYLKVVPWLIRPIAGLISPHMHRIRRHHKNARALLIPEILRRRQLGAQSPDWKTGKPNDMLQWLEDASSGDDSRPERIVDRQLGMSFAAIHTTTNHITNVLYDLAARWDEYGPELRAEVEECLAESGGAWKKTTLTKMSKMDSFMRESQRMHPPSARGLSLRIAIEFAGFAHYQFSFIQPQTSSSAYDHVVFTTTNAPKRQLHCCCCRPNSILRGHI